MADGWIKIQRSLSDKGWSKKPEYVALWVHLLLLANHTNTEYFWNSKTINLKAGQFITGRKRLSEISGISETSVERILNCFEKEQQIGQQKTNTSRLISILNWDKYQKVGQRSGQRTDNGRTTDEQRTDTKEEYKEREECKELKKNNWDVLFEKWIDYRKEKKKPLTASSIPIALNELKKISGENIDVAQKIVNKSIASGWQGLFPLKSEDGNGTTQKNNAGKLSPTGIQPGTLTKDTFGKF